MQAKGSNRPSALVRTYHFDVEKADELFDILLESKYINLCLTQGTKFFLTKNFKEENIANSIVLLHIPLIIV
jgi:hypothetical protein